MLAVLMGGMTQCPCYNIAKRLLQSGKRAKPMPVHRLDDFKTFRSDKMAKNSLVDSERLFFDLYCLEPNQEQRPHTHADSDKVYVVMEGRPHVLLGDEEIQLEPGMMAHARPGEMHGLINRADERAVLVVTMAPRP